MRSFLRPRLFKKKTQERFRWTEEFLFGPKNNKLLLRRIKSLVNLLMQVYLCWLGPLMVICMKYIYIYAFGIMHSLLIEPMTLVLQASCPTVWVKTMQFWFHIGKRHDNCDWVDVMIVYEGESGHSVFVCIVFCRVVCVHFSQIEPSWQDLCLPWFAVT